MLRFAFLVVSCHALLTPAPATTRGPMIKRKLGSIRSLALPGALGAATLLAPQAAAAAAAAPPFVLFGKTSAQLFPVQNFGLPTWLLLFFAPRWRRTKHLALAAPLAFSALYTLVLAHCVRFPTPGLAVDFTSLAGIMRGFTIADGAFAGWLHYLVFDPCVGLGIVLDAQQHKVPHLLCVPCLLLTMLAGPMGFLAYYILRNTTLAWRGKGFSVRSAASDYLAKL